MTPNSISLNQTATLTADVSDSFATVTAAEYYEGTDPGEGNGTPMTVANGVASATLSSSLSLGQHTFTVRAKNSLGNWTRGTLPTATLTVTLPVLTGRVLNGANEGISGVRVDVVDPSNHANIIATTTTDSGNYAGVYSVAISTPGTYDVIFTPSGTTYEPLTKTGINLTTSATLDVVLVLAPHTLTGTLKDKFNVPIPGATISLHNQGGQTVNATTGSDGSFTATVNPATYTVTISGTKAAAPQAFVPATFTLSGGSFDLTSDINQDFVLTAVSVTFTTKSALTLATVGNVALDVSTSTSTTLYTGSATYSGSSTYSVTTNESGVASVVLLSGSQFTVDATPPPNSGVVETQFTFTDLVTSDIANRDLLLNANIKHFKGALVDNSGTGIPNATVTLSGPLGTFQATTGGDGSFDVQVAAGAYTLAVSGGKPSGSTLHIPDSYSFTGGNVDLSSQDVNQTLTLSAATVRVTAKTSFDTPLSGVNITLVSAPGNADLYTGGSFSASATSSGQTNSSGYVDLYVTTGLSYTTKAVPAGGSGYITTNLPASSPVTTDTAWDIVLNRDLKTFTGTVKDINGAAVAGATVKLDGNEPDQHYSTTTDSNGAFTLHVAPNSAYALQVSGTSAASPMAYVPDNFTLLGITDITGDKTQDITVSAVKLDIFARDDRLAPIANVAITFASTGSQGGFTASSSNISRVTGSDGHITARLLMLAGTTYTISATPPPNMGYINTTFNGTSPITQDSEAIIEFQNHIPLAPAGLTAQSPTNTSPVLSWSAVANADHYNIYRDGVLVGVSTVTSFTDITLTADGTYQYTVTAVSSDDYESPKSNTVTVVYDTTAPDIQYTLTPTPSSNGWNDSPVTVTFTCSDALSGVAVCPGAQDVTADGTHTLTATAVDNAGNTKTITFDVDLDQTAPTITYTVTPTPNSDGWNNSDVTVTFACQDSTSGIASCSSPVTVNAEGASQTITGTTMDNAGNTASATATINLDKTAPVVTGLSWTANPLPQGQSTTLSAMATDSLSGVASMYYTLDGGSPHAMTYDVGSNTWQAALGSDLAVNTYNIAVFAIDKAGNTSAGLMDVLAVYNTANGSVSGHAWVLPTAADTLPIALDTSAHPAQMVVGFSSQQGATTSVDVHYVIKNNQDEFDFSSTTVDWVVIPDSAHASIMVQGDLTTYVNGVEMVTHDVVMRLDIALGASGAPDQVTVRMWNPGLSPSNAAPTYQISDDDIQAKSQVLIH
ncbi:MAG TPA: carboxypeptidase regulatory-like domain-containing protein [Ktedonobacterales bacterium]|nr:carboxypeptidase regulatory-like domain-containing protein [Ktedonobacterales bacterium]